ncbi:hypothetical protein BdWA1_002299 [Babesia duncani]|uniref:Uncharacterized protein n=1 Tax=Babesia duncani TaxID=323732 RepID=A0AAD9PJ01_9APIC|nr:hypothetical protein BdWA1_002299 [Babesia duncani]
MPPMVRNRKTSHRTSPPLNWTASAMHKSCINKSSGIVVSALQILFLACVSVSFSIRTSPFSTKSIGIVGILSSTLHG